MSVMNVAKYSVIFKALKQHCIIHILLHSV